MVLAGMTGNRKIKGVQYEFRLGVSPEGERTCLVAFTVCGRLYWFHTVGDKITKRLRPVDVRKMFPEIHDTIYQLVLQHKDKLPTYGNICRVSSFSNIQPSYRSVEGFWLL